MQTNTTSTRLPSTSQPPSLLKEKGFKFIEQILNDPDMGEEDARRIDREKKIGYFAYLDSLKAGTIWLDKFITVNPEMLRLKEKVKLLATEPDTVLILGESGTGKELIARALHGTKDQATFIDINCAGLPEHLIEAELFGYTEGSFTGALKGGREGLFQKAAGGTLFLDEIGELPLNLQAKLLRVLQERRVRRVGAHESEPITCRFICATHQDLITEVSNKAFRLDLYYRISTITLQTLPLEKRVEDIPLIVRELDKHKGTFPTDFNWPLFVASHPSYMRGNVRSLEQLVRRYQLFKELPTI